MKITKTKHTKRFIVSSGGLKVFIDNAWEDNSSPSIIVLCDGDNIKAEIEESSVKEFKVKFKAAGGVLE